MLSTFSPLWTIKLRTSISCQTSFPNMVTFFLESSKEKSVLSRWAVWFYMAQLQWDMPSPCHILLVRSLRPCLHSRGGHYAGHKYRGTRIVGVTLEYLPQSIACSSVIHVPSIGKMYFTYSQGPQKFHSIKSSPQVPEPFCLNQAQI